MAVVEIDPQHHIQCFACQSLCSGPAYACRACEYFLHKSCADLPLLIQHPAHSFHPLFLRVIHRWFICNICQKEKENTLVYDCKQCDDEFQMCVKCCHEFLLSLCRPSIKYRYHEHFLYFIENYAHLAQCNASDNYCHQSVASHDLHHTTNSLFFCRNCDFKIHFICGPLPSTIKHECHMHSLILVDSIEDNFEEYYCDVCEFERNPRIRVYHCKNCQYIAHPHCVTSEIVKVFNGDLGGVELKVIGQDFWEQPHEEEWDLSSSFTLSDLLSSDDLTEDEKSYLNRWFKWDKSSKGEEDSKVEVADEDIIDEIITRYPFFNQQEDLTRFFFDEFGRFLRNEKLVVKSTDLSLKIVGVQGYSIPVTLAPVLQTLLHKYPDITTSDSKMTPAMKSICFFFLCKVRNSMHTTRFSDITKNLLRDWYYYLKFLRSRGFRIDFLMEALTKVTRAFAGVQLARLETEVPTKLNKKIVKLQQEIADLKAKEDICNKLFESSSDPKFIKDIFREGAEFKWKTADQVLF
ncbi:hypothetical protein UlMin_009089 [Ulmus minor]